MIRLERSKLVKDSEETQWERLLWQIKLKQKVTKIVRKIGRTGSQGSTEATDVKGGQLEGPAFPNWKGSTEATDVESSGVEGAKTSLGHNF